MRAYYLYNPDYQGLGIIEIAEEMGTSPAAVEWLLSRFKRDNPDLFTDISSDGRQFDYGVVQYGSWCDRFNVIKKQF